MIHILRHSQQVQREDDGAVHFWRIKENLQNPFPHSPHWSDDRWKACLAAGGGAKRICQYCTDESGIIIYFRALQGHSGRNLIDPSLQDNVVIPNGFFQYIYNIGSGFNLHSIINSGLIPGGQNSSKRQTVFFLPVDPRDKSHKDPDEIDLNVPRHAQYLHNAWKRHQDAVYWVDIDLAIQKGLTFYQTRSNAIILQETLPAYCIPKVVRLKTGEVLYEKVCMSPRPPPKISLRHEWTRKLGSKVVRQPEGEAARQPEGEVGRQTKFFQSTQPPPNPIRDRSGRPDDMQDERNTSFSQEINVNSFNEELSSSDRTGRLVETEVIQTRSSEDRKSLNVEQTHDRTGRPVANTAAVQDDSQVCHEADTLNVDDEVLAKRMEKSIVVHDENHEPMMVNEADMDFRIPGLPHSVVKHAQSTCVRQLIQKIENHPDRHALQQDLRQNQSFNPFSPESKHMIRDVGNIELCELLETEPKKQCNVCLSNWNIGILYCTCGHFLHKERGENQKFIKDTTDLLSVPEYAIKKGRPHGHRYGKKLGDREYFSANQLKKKCKKKFVHGIHDRFIGDETFRNRMIENGRDEDVCRQWDALADEDHTHHLTPQEYYHYKSNWWLHSNKTGSNTVPVKHRPDFKQAFFYLAAIETKRRRSFTNVHGHPPTSTMGTEFFFFFIVELARFMVDSLFL